MYRSQAHASVSNSYRKAHHAGKKKTAENIHRARQVGRPAIAENMDELEEFKKWKKDIAYLKDIDANDYRDNGMISILLDFVPDEVHKEISMKYATVGSNAIDLRTAMLEVERIIEREKDRVQSRRDRQTKGKISALQEEVAEDFYVWNDEANSGYGGFVLAAKRVRQGEEDEEEAQQERGVRGKVETGTGEVQQRSGKAKGGNGEGSRGAESRMCFPCGEEGHLKAQCPLRWYVPKTVFGNWWNSSPFASFQGKGKSKSGGKGRKGKEKGNLEFSTADGDDGGVGVLAVGVLGLQLRAEQ